MFHLSPFVSLFLVPQELRVGHPWREALRGGGAAGSEAGTAGGAAAAEDGGGRALKKWVTNITMERSTIFNGKIHYKWGYPPSINVSIVMGVPSGNLLHSYWTWPAIVRGFTHWTWWFSIAMLIYQRLPPKMDGLYKCLFHAKSNEHGIKWMIWG